MDKKVMQFALNGVGSYVGIVQSSYGVPPGFWQNPYILGFLGEMAALFAQLAAGAKINGSDLQYLLQEVFAASNAKNFPTLQEYNNIKMTESTDAELQRGCGDATSVFLYASELHSDEAGDSLVTEATSLVDSGEVHFLGTRRERVGAAMLLLSYINEVRRLGHTALAKACT